MSVANVSPLDAIVRQNPTGPGSTRSGEYAYPQDMPKKPRPRKRAPLAEVAYQNNVVRESLPLPAVHYPGHYGSVFAFADNEGQPPKICGCSRVAVENYLELRALGGTPRNAHADRRAILSTHWFPLSLARQSSNEPDLHWLEFEDGICHRCAGKAPMLRYCHEMYGGAFKQAWGWYIGLEFLNLGIGTPHLLPDRGSLTGAEVWREYLPGSCPAELVVLLEEECEAWTGYEDSRPDRMSPGDEHQLKAARAATHQLATAVENRARESLGYRRVGEAWTSETTLAKLVEQVFPGETVIRHHRPAWLQGLELDIFVERHALGIEYQGIQHYEPIDHWGGAEALEALQKRDAAKAARCSDVGVRLLCFDYTEPLTEAHLRKRLAQLDLP